MLLEGIFAATTTPFYSDERIYFRKIEANIARYSRSLLAGMVVLGSTGEAPLLDDAESREVLRVAAEAAAPEKVLIAGVGRESVKATLEMADAAAGFRYDAVLVRPPSYYAGQISSAAVLHYFRSIADRSPLPSCSTTFLNACRTRFRWSWWGNWPVTPTLSGSRIR